jgi:hypothetical protein
LVLVSVRYLFVLGGVNFEISPKTGFLRIAEIARVCADLVRETQAFLVGALSASSLPSRALGE